MRYFLLHIAVILIAVFPAFSEGGNTGQKGGADRISLQVDWEIYPNPMEKNVYVDINGINGDKEISYLSVKNSIGKEVRFVSLSKANNDTPIRLNVQELNAGVYYFSLYSSGKVVSVKRVIKSH